ncbi:glycosyltransferase [Ideonella sp.]|uniref:glycosyltransferase n=1 Tax=Ideonella sp. TaxID=1929293 RepID=UPI003BB575F0
MKPRVLLVTFNRLFPADQGNSRRIMQLVAQYERMGFEIDLLYHNDEGVDLSLAHATEARFGLVRVVRSRASKRIREGHVCHIADWYDPAIEAVASAMHCLRDYKVVHINYIWYAPLLSKFGGGVLKVLDSHDVFAERSDKYRAAGMLPNWFSTTLSEEDRAFKQADAVLAIQREEAQEMVARGHRNILYLPYVEPRVRPFSLRAGRSRPVLGYLGSANDWNVRSMQAFGAALRQESAALPFQLVVAGGICKHVREMPGLVTLGFVKELHTFYDSIDLAINPMVGGTGLKIKTVEPLCYGKPVLTTPSGAQGLQHLWTQPIFEDPEAMVRYLLGEFATQTESELRRLAELAASSRAALDREYDGQIERFAAWLQASLKRA